MSKYEIALGFMFMFSIQLYLSAVLYTFVITVAYEKCFSKAEKIFLLFSCLFFWQIILALYLCKKRIEKRNGFYLNDCISENSLNEKENNCPGKL